MCTTNVFTYVHADGRREQSYQPTLCGDSRHGKPCAGNVVFQHPPQYVAMAAPMAGSQQLPFVHQFPPTPTYTPRSNTPNHRSGDESDRSYHSSSSARRRPQGVYINGQRVLELNRRDRPSRSERIVITDSPPTPLTPPQAFSAPYSAPSSPSVPFIVQASPRTRHSHSSSYRPIIVDERQRPSKHTRHTSTSSHDSRYSYHSAEDEAQQQERIRRREEVRTRRHQEEEQARRQRLSARIAKANAEIANRPAVPMPPRPLKRSSTAHVAAEREAELVDAVRRMSFEEARRDEKSRRLEEKAERAEVAAQKQRLRERMQPTRRATVGPGSRRPKVSYDEGVYRWE